jgi:apolipoprotein N-acyltransferase
MLRALVFASVWVSGEQLRSVWPFGGFPWGRLAFSQTDGPLLTLAWLGGAPLVAFAVALGGALLAATMTAAARREVAGMLVPGALAGAVLVPAALISPPVDAETGVLRAGVVQGNVPADRDRVDRAEVVLANHVHGTAAVADQAGPGRLDLVVWPENAADVDPRSNADAAAQVWAASDAVRAPILVGTDRYEPEGRYNDIVVWDPERGPVDSYAKQRPAPFGEYVPLRGLIRVFSSQVDRVEVDMVAGTAPAVVDIPVARLGRVVPVATVICFEVAFDDLVRDAVRQGAQLLVVPTNNASFGWTAQSTQQLAMSRLRAVETGRATIQASTVGVSAVIEPDGTVVQRTGLFTPATLSADLPLRTSRTPAVQAGPAPVAGAVLIAATAAGGGALATRSRRADRADGSAPTA